MEYLNAFLCGGLLCAVGQIILDKTSLTPARILTGYVVAGVLLQAVGVYQYIVDWGGAGATVPLTGFWLLPGEGRGQSGGGGGPAGCAHRRTDRHLRRYRRGGGVFPVGGAAGAAQRKTLTNTRWGYIMRP